MENLDKALSLNDTIDFYSSYIFFAQARDVIRETKLRLKQGSKPTTLFNALNTALTQAKEFNNKFLRPVDNRISMFFNAVERPIDSDYENYKQLLPLLDDILSKKNSRQDALRIINSMLRSNKQIMGFLSSDWNSGSEDLLIIDSVKDLLKTTENLIQYRFKKINDTFDDMQDSINQEVKDDVKAIIDNVKERNTSIWTILDVSVRSFFGNYYDPMEDLKIITNNNYQTRVDKSKIEEKEPIAGFVIATVAIINLVAAVFSSELTYTELMKEIKKQLQELIVEYPLVAVSTTLKYEADNITLSIRNMNKSLDLMRNQFESIILKRINILEALNTTLDDPDFSISDVAKSTDRLKANNVDWNRFMRSFYMGYAERMKQKRYKVGKD
ncbi:hypothetical protein K3G69_04540 [Phytobacter diazotrophicus]|uniref:hypothetical protein n=1 Tax=Phytobacter diazotrophicus TaxID=395631 RepID=UPI001C9942EA|nr:hypothetical protein [Phytobacter diazotrophicus]MBY6255768.1 hypothetical protein [Phytobacter diazotrophicus]